MERSAEHKCSPLLHFRPTVLESIWFTSWEELLELSPCYFTWAMSLAHTNGGLSFFSVLFLSPSSCFQYIPTVSGFAFGGTQAKIITKNEVFFLNICSEKLWDLGVFVYSMWTIWGVGDQCYSPCCFPDYWLDFMWPTVSLTIIWEKYTHSF